MPPIELVLEENQALKGRVDSLTEEVADLKAELAIFRKQIFGSGKNEKQDKAQLLLTLGQLEATLVAHCEHGCTQLDNNLMENAIRPSAIGKKNFLFIGHPDAGDRSAIIYSIIVSCQRRGIDPLAYMRDVLSRLPSMTNRDDLGALTPARWQPAAAVV
jgi:hypothetical protein